MSAPICLFIKSSVYLRYDHHQTGRGNKLYAEFTRLSDYNFSAPDIFVEIFDVTSFSNPVSTPYITMSCHWAIFVLMPFSSPTTASLNE